MTREVGPVGNSEVMGSASGTATGYATERFLEVRNLTVEFPSEDGVVHAVNDLSFGLDPGRTMAIVGESGSGKSVTSQAIMGLHKGGRARVSGEVWFDGQELVSLSDEEMRPLRGEKMAMIFQDPLSSLHPYYKVGAQIAEAYRTHNKVSKGEAKKRSIEMLERVGVPNPDKRFDQYPHEFSGGMRQRAMIAMALVCDPKLLIADEPTTALDVTVQAQILELMKDLQREFNSAIILITHDLGVVAEMADDVVVMYGGRCVEHASVRDGVREPADALHLGPARLHASARPRPAGAPRADRRLAALARQPAERLCVPPALPVQEVRRGERLLRRTPGVARGGARALRPLPHRASGPPAGLRRTDQAAAVSASVSTGTSGSRREELRVRV